MYIICHLFIKVVILNNGKIKNNKNDYPEGKEEKEYRDGKDGGERSLTMPCLIEQCLNN